VGSGVSKAIGNIQVSAVLVAGTHLPLASLDNRLAVKEGLIRALLEVRSPVEMVHDAVEAAGLVPEGEALSLRLSEALDLLLDHAIGMTNDHE
jgi:hypothetical protein